MAASCSQDLALGGAVLAQAFAKPAPASGSQDLALVEAVLAQDFVKAGQATAGPERMPPESCPDAQVIRGDFAILDMRRPRG